MTMKRVLPLLLLAGLAFASAKSYTVTLFQPTLVGTTELKPGDYKVEVNSQTVTISSGKVKTESQVKVEEGAEKYDKTAVRYINNPGGKVTIQEIRLGGTKTKILFTM
jgi:hypothetical protein